MFQWNKTYNHRVNSDGISILPLPRLLVPRCHLSSPSFLVCLVDQEGLKSTELPVFSSRGYEVVTFLHTRKAPGADTCRAPLLPFSLTVPDDGALQKNTTIISDMCMAYWVFLNAMFRKQIHYPKLCPLPCIFFKQDVFGNRSGFRNVVLGYPKMMGNAQNSCHIFIIPISISQRQTYVLELRDSSIFRYLKWF